MSLCFPLSENKVKRREQTHDLLKPAFKQHLKLKNQRNTTQISKKKKKKKIRTRRDQWLIIYFVEPDWQKEINKQDKINRETPVSDTKGQTPLSRSVGWVRGMGSKMGSYSFA